MITNNKDLAIKKIGELQLHLMKEKDTLPTMISSFERFGSFPEVKGGPPIGASFRDQVARMELQVKAQTYVPKRQQRTIILPRGASGTLH